MSKSYFAVLEQVENQNIEAEQTQSEMTCFEIKCPQVGQFIPSVGKRFQASGGMVLGTLVTLGRRTPLLLPNEGILKGRVLECTTVQNASDLYTRCGYHSVLYTAILMGGESLHDEINSSGSATHSTHQDADLIESPIDGTVYYAPSPDQPPFVEIGQVIQPNQVIALVEVMKFFYEIKYEGTQPARIVEQVHQSGKAIEAGQGLWWVRAESGS